MKRFIGGLLCLALCGLAAGCRTEETPPERVSLIVQTPPMGMVYDAARPDTEAADLIREAADAFVAQYRDAEVSIVVNRFSFLDEKAQVIDKFGTDEAADILFAGSFNLPTYILEGRLAPLDDVIDEAMLGDIDDGIWAQCRKNGKTYTLPYFQLQNTLMVHEPMMRAAGLADRIPPPGTIARWSTEEFNAVLEALHDSLNDADNTFPLFMYAANNQGDIHIMTLLRAYGCPVFDEKDRFAFHTPEGVRALTWLAELNRRGITPYGAENIALLDCQHLFARGQLAIGVANPVMLSEVGARKGGVFLANFPSLDGRGFATSYVNGFSVFDNGDPDKVRVAKDFVRFICSDETLLRYSLAGTPVRKSYVARHRGEVYMMEAYSANSANVVDFLHNTPNWEGVRAAFYPHIQDLLRGVRTPEQVAAALDRDCNAAIEQGVAAAARGKSASGRPDTDR